MSKRQTEQPVLHHVNLKTKRLQAMIDWYGEVAGMTPRFAFPGGAWLSNDAANHRLALLATPSLSDDPDKLAHTGMHHIAFRTDDIEAQLKQASAGGIRLIHEKPFAGAAGKLVAFLHPKSTHGVLTEFCACAPGAKAP